MGKASQTLSRLISQSLTNKELEERRAAAENGGDVQATPDGRLVKIDERTAQSRPAGQAAPRTWD